jgi:hypothetical protein
MALSGQGQLIALLDNAGRMVMLRWAVYCQENFLQGTEKHQLNRAVQPMLPAVEGWS